MNGSTEKRTIEVEAYRDENGKPTCCLDWKTKRCKFISTIRFGSIILCGATCYELTHDDDGDSLIRPRHCPVWPESS